MLKGLGEKNVANCALDTSITFGVGGGRGCLLAFFEILGAFTGTGGGGGNSQFTHSLTHDQTSRTRGTALEHP